MRAKVLQAAMVVAGAAFGSSLGGVASADVFNMLSGLTSLETVPVGNAGNTGDTRQYGSGNGAVAYNFRIGKFEITTGQYCAFLNAVAVTDTYGLYDPSMNGGREACQIIRSGAPGSYTYQVGSDWANRPVNLVSWGSAARFTNWLTNGQPSGSQTLSTTEDGSYLLNGATSTAALMAVTRKNVSGYFIPTTDEWYKAAYHKNDGATGNYWLYPTRSDTAPSNALLTTDPGNSANYCPGSSPTIGSPYYRTNVGQFANSASPYGTFDQGGNVFEWVEATYSNQRLLWGGYYWNGAFGLKADYRFTWALDPSTDAPAAGFRISVIPAVITLGNISNATVIRGGTGSLGLSVTNSGIASLSYKLSADVQSGSCALGLATPGLGSLSPNASQSSTFSATSTTLGTNTVLITAAIPNASGDPQMATATLTVLDHSNASLSASTNLTSQTINLGNVLRGASLPGQVFTIYNRAVNTTAANTTALKLTGFVATGDSSIRTSLSAFDGLAAGHGNTYAVSLDTANFATGSKTIIMSASQLADDSSLSGAGSNNNGGIVVTLQSNVGIGTVGYNHQLGTALTAPVTAGSSFGGLASKTLTDVANGVVGTEATILDGASSTATTVSMAWRTRTDAEIAKSLLSDVVDVEGTQGIYVLQLTYSDPTGFAATHPIKLAYNAATGWAGAEYVVGGTGPELGAWTGQTTLGQYGSTYDPLNHLATVWTVVDMNGEFSAVPQPAAVWGGLLGFAGLGLTVARSKARNARGRAS